MFVYMYVTVAQQKKKNCKALKMLNLKDKAIFNPLYIWMVTL